MAAFKSAFFLSFNFFLLEFHIVWYHHYSSFIASICLVYLCVLIFSLSLFFKCLSCVTYSWVLLWIQIIDLFILIDELSPFTCRELVLTTKTSSQEPEESLAGEWFSSFYLQIFWSLGIFCLPLWKIWFCVALFVLFAFLYCFARHTYHRTRHLLLSSATQKPPIFFFFSF